MPDTAPATTLAATSPFAAPPGAPAPAAPAIDIPVDAPEAQHVSATPPAPAIDIPVDSPEAQQVTTRPPGVVDIPVDTPEAQGVLSKQGYLEQLPESAIVAQFVEEDAAGQKPDAAVFRAAYAKRSAEGNFFDARDLRPSTTPPVTTGLMEKGVAIAESLATGFMAHAKSTIGVLTGQDLSKPFGDWTMTLPEYKQNAGENVAAIASLPVATADTLWRMAAHIVNATHLPNYNFGGDNSGKARTAGDQFDTAVALAKAHRFVIRGGLTPSVGLDHPAPGALPINPEVTAQISQSPIDPSILAPGMLSARAATLTKTAVTALTAEEAAAKAGLAARTAARTTEIVSGLVKKTGSIIENHPVTRAVAVGGGAMAAGADPITAFVLATASGAETKGLTALEKGLAGTASKLDATAAWLRANHPPVGPIGKFAAGAMRNAEGAAKWALGAQIPNLPFVLGAKNQDEAESAIVAGFLARGMFEAPGMARTGLDVATNLYREGARSPEVRAAVTSHVSDPAFVDLENTHTDTVKQVNNAGNNLIQAIRGFLGKNAPNTQTYIGGARRLAQNLVDMSRRGAQFIGEDGKPIQITPESAAQLTAHNGVVLDVITPGEGKGADGTPAKPNRRTVSLVPFDPGAQSLGLGHEFGHLLMDSVMSPEEKAHFLQETANAYGQDNIEAARQHYAQMGGWDPKTMSDARVLSELFAENVSARVNGMPVLPFGPSGDVRLDTKSSTWRKYVRETAALYERTIGRIGAKVPDTAYPVVKVDKNGNKYTVMEPGKKGVRTGLGWQASDNLGALIDNFLESRRVDSAVAESQGAPDPHTEQPNASADGNPITGAHDIAPPPAFKKGDPIGEVKVNGKVFATNAVVSKVIVDPEGKHQYEIEYTDPANGKRRIGTVPESALQSPVKPGASTAPKEPATVDVGALNPVPVALTTASPTGSDTGSSAAPAAPAEPAPVAPAPAGAAPAKPANLRTNEQSQQAFGARKATPEVVAHNTSLLRRAVSFIRSKIPVFETDYYSAKNTTIDESAPDAAVRKQQRALADAAEAEGYVNPLRKLYQKLFVPYKFIDGPTPRVFGFSFDKLIQNIDILRQWAKQNGHTDLVARLDAPTFTQVVHDYHENQRNGFGGDGTRLVRTAATKPGSLTPETPGYEPHKLSVDDKELVNFLMGIPLPKKGTPATMWAAEMARANGLSPTLDANGVEVTNPVRLNAIKAGFDPRLLNSTVENLPIDRFTTKLKERPDLQSTAGDVGITQAGFMPKTEPKGKDLFASHAEKFFGVPGTAFNSNNGWGFGGADGVRWNKTLADGRRIRVTLGTASTRHMGEYPFVKVTEDGRTLVDETSNKAGLEQAKRALDSLQVTPDSVKKLLQGKNWAIMSASKAGKTPEENAAANAALLKKLEDAGHDVTPVQGDYGGDKENSFLVHGITSDEAHDLGNQFKQDSVLVPEGLRYHDNTVTPHDGTIATSATPFKENYSTIPATGQHFQYGLDFDKRLPAPGALANAPEPAPKHMPLGDEVPDREDVHYWLRRASASTGSKRNWEIDNFTQALVHADNADFMRAVEKTPTSLLRDIADRYNLPVDESRGERLGVLSAVRKEAAFQRKMLAQKSAGGPQHMPKDDHIKWPAVRFTDEKGHDWEYSAPRHAEAEQKLVDALGFVPHYNDVQDGFVTYGGEFLDRDQAYRRANETGQYAEKPGNAQDRGSLISERVRGMAPREQFMPGKPVQHGGEPLEHSLGDETLNLIHFGGTGMKEVDPKMFGKSGLTPTSELAGSPRSYFYVQGSHNGKDPAAGRPNVYGAKVSGAKIYDGDSDPLGYRGIVNREKADNLLQDAGYVGISRTVGRGKGQYQQVELYEPTKVAPIDSPTSKFMPATKVEHVGLSKERLEELKNDPNVVWHGSGSGDLRGGPHGLHVGTYEAAKQALNARIGIPAEGDWDGTREYGKTLLKGASTLGLYEGTGFNMDVPEKPFYPTNPPPVSSSVAGGRIYGTLDMKPSITPFRISGKMSNFRSNAYGDWRANGMMRGQLKKGNAKSGYYYTNEAEDAGSVSAVLPNGGHLDQIKFMPKATAAQEKQLKDSAVRGAGGALLPLFHATYNAFNKFRIGDLGFHFGTEAAANARIGKSLADVQPGVEAEHGFAAFPETRAALPPGARGPLEQLAEGARTIPVFLDIKNPLRMHDVGPWDDPGEVYDAAKEALFEHAPKGSTRAFINFLDRKVALEDRVFDYNNDINSYVGSTEKFDAYKEKLAKPVLAAIRDGLKSLGYDGVVYQNKFEAPGEMMEVGAHGIEHSGGADSYIAFDHKQIVPAYADNPKARWMPGKPAGGAEEWVDRAALRDGEGKIYKGQSHWEAMQLAAAEKNRDPWDMDYNGFDDGFVTNKGRFLSREDAMKMAVDTGQIDKKEYMARGFPGGDEPHPENPMGGARLESNSFRAAQHMPQTETPEFKKFFGASKVVDENGAPLTTYHQPKGIDKVTEFNKDFIRHDPDLGVHGFWFGAGGKKGVLYYGRTSAETVAAYLSLQNPASRAKVSEVRAALEEAGTPNDQESVTNELKRQGYDGVISRPYHAWTPKQLAETQASLDATGEAKLPDTKQFLRVNKKDGGLDLIGQYGGHVTGYSDLADFARQDRESSGIYVAFEPTQIKSATGNSGAFDPTNPDIRYMPKDKTAIPGEPEPQDILESRPYKQLAKHLTPEEADGIRRNTAKRMVDVFKELPPDSEFEAAAKAGQIKRGWYARAAATLKTIFGDDTERFVGLLAATSPRQSVQENLNMALRIWADWQDAGRPTDTATLTRIAEEHAEMHSRVPNSVKALQGHELADDELSGYKVESFRRNLLGDLQAVTNDSWMSQFGNIDQKLFSTKAGYLAYSAKVRRVAKRLGMEPAEVQETVWSFFKSLKEGTNAGRSSKETLRSLSDSDILNTPEFHDQILNDPAVKAQLERLGFTGFDELAPPADSARPVERRGSLAEVATQEGGQGRLRALERVANRAQRVHDLEQAKKQQTRKKGALAGSIMPDDTTPDNPF